MAQLIKNLPAMQETWFLPLGKIPWRGKQLPAPLFWPGEFLELYSPWGYKEIICGGVHTGWKKKVGYMLREKAMRGLSRKTAAWQPKRERP